MNKLGKPTLEMQLEIDIKRYGKMLNIGMITKKEMIDTLREKHGFSPRKETDENNVYLCKI